MNSRQLFKNHGIKKSTPVADTHNEAGGEAFSFSDKAALAQFAVTGTFSNVFYSDASSQLARVEELCSKVDSQFLAKLAVYARTNGRMKDMPAFFLAVLAARGEIGLVRSIFYRVCDNSKMLFNFIRIIRSGSVGRRSFGTAIKKLIQGWVTSKSDKGLFLSSIGHSDPSMSDTIRMVHPRPNDDAQANMFSYLLGTDYVAGLLPFDVQLFEQLKNGETTEIPDVPFRALTNCPLTVHQWREIALNMPWNTLRQNLNMLQRKGVFDDARFTTQVADKLADGTQVRIHNVFPYQIMSTYLATKGNMPIEISNALQSAMEHAVENVPVLKGQTVIAVDVSSSMRSAVASSSNVRCVDVAALIAVSLMRTNKNSVLLPFDYIGRSWYSHGIKDSDMVYKHDINPFDSILTNAVKLAAYGGGGTDCSLPFQYINKQGLTADNVILISDNQSWSGLGGHNGVMIEWTKHCMRNKSAKLANIDIQPYDTTQAKDKDGSIVNVAGWSDEVFNYLGSFFNGMFAKDFVALIESVPID